MEAGAGSDGEFLSALCLSSFDDISAIGSAHSSKESMRSFSLAPVGLIRPLHGSSLFVNSRAEVFVGAQKNRVQYSPRGMRCQAVSGCGWAEMSLESLFDVPGVHAM